MAAMLAMATPTFGADTDADALALQSSPDKASETPTATKYSVEAAIGTGQRRFLPGTDALRRFSADIVYSTRFDQQWRAFLSNRVDAVDPHRGAKTVNSLRELYVGWQDDATAWVVDVGRINLRQGPAIGFNPTDFFRDGSVRVSTTVNPLLVREYRLGSVMARAQRLWPDGSLSLAVSPKLGNAPSSDGFNADLGATNNRSRSLLSLSNQWSAKASSQFHVYKERGVGAQLGASFSGLAGDATVAYAEGSWGREPSLFDRSVGAQTKKSSGRVVAGATYTTESKLSVTGEVGYNGYASSRSQWNAIAASQQSGLVAYLVEADRRQDLAARHAVLVYAKQTDALTRNLDATALVRLNTDDHSTLTWLEVRYRFEQFDLSGQWLRYRGASLTEFGLSPYKTSVQVVLTAYF